LFWFCEIPTTSVSFFLNSKRGLVFLTSPFFLFLKLKHILKRLRAWYDIQTFEPVSVSEGKEELKEMFETPEIDVDIKEADEQGCMKCSRKKKVKK